MSSSAEAVLKESRVVSMLAPVQEPTEDQDNLLLMAAKPLVSLMVTIKEIEECHDIAFFREKILEQIRYFEYRASLQKYSSRTILAARYVICTAIDEVVLKTAWGKRSIWLQHSLLLTLHSELVGGEKFYIILEEFLKDPNENYHLLELLYYLLSLGFEGKYYNDQMAWAKTRDNLFRVLQKAKKKEFIFSTGAATFFKKNRFYILPVWMILLLSGSILLCITLVLENYSNQQKDVIYSFLSKMRQIEKNEAGSP